MTSTIKVNTIQNTCGADIIKESSNTITIGASGDTITLGSGASQTGFGRTGTVDWQTGSIKTSTFTAVSGEGYFVNTTGGAIEVDLPAGTAGAIVAFKDYANTFDDNNLTIDPNGSENIGGGTAGEAAVVDTEGASVTLVYVDSTKGWLLVNDGTLAVDGIPAAYVAASGGTITTQGDFKFHTFTSPGTFTVSNAGNSKGSNTVQALVVAGGGSGTANGGAGGGAGGLRNLACQPVTATGFPVTVGAGATGGPPVKSCGGSDSVYAGTTTITSAGGGSGGEAGGQPEVKRNGDDGGSGGGGGGNGGNATTGGTGNTPPVSPPQGFPGGSNPPQPNFNAGTGGGGATGAGAAPPAPGTPGSIGGTGGDGADVTPSFPAPLGGSPAGFYAGGGGGGGNDDGPGNSSQTPNAPGGGGRGGGGPGGVAGENGTANTGGGGGGQPTNGGPGSGNGGSGIVIIKYKFQN